MALSKQDANITYILSVTVLSFVFPAIGFLAEHYLAGTALSLELFGKWFIFFAVGVRVFLAGIKQTTKPAFTAKAIFHINSSECFPIVRELGFANLCFGLVGLISLFIPDWRIVSAFASGLYFGLAGVQHFLKKPAGTNEKFALWTDLVIFLVLAWYVVKMVNLTA